MQRKKLTKNQREFLQEYEALCQKHRLTLSASRRTFPFMVIKPIPIAAKLVSLSGKVNFETKKERTRIAFYKHAAAEFVVFGDIEQEGAKA